MGEKFVGKVNDVNVFHPVVYERVEQVDFRRVCGRYTVPGQSALVALRKVQVHRGGDLMVFDCHVVAGGASR